MDMFGHLEFAGLFCPEFFRQYKIETFEQMGAWDMFGIRAASSIGDDYKKWVWYW